MLLAAQFLAAKGESTDLKSKLAVPEEETEKYSWPGSHILFTAYYSGLARSNMGWKDATEAKKVYHTIICKTCYRDCITAHIIIRSSGDCAGGVGWHLWVESEPSNPKGNFAIIYKFPHSARFFAILLMQMTHDMDKSTSFLVSFLIFRPVSIVNGYSTLSWRKRDIGLLVVTTNLPSSNLTPTFFFGIRSRQLRCLIMLLEILYKKTHEV